MLPVYLSLYLGQSDSGDRNSKFSTMIPRALIVGLAMTSGLLALFGVAGIFIAITTHFVVIAMPWAGLFVGFSLVMLGSWVLCGGKIYSPFFSGTGSRIGDPNQTTVKGYFLFGISYGIVSLGCTLPIFLSVVGSTFFISGFRQAVGQFLLYGLGMASVIMVLTLGVGIFKGVLLHVVRNNLKFVNVGSSVLMIVSGLYVVYFWLTIGGLNLLG